MSAARDAQTAALEASVEAHAHEQQLPAVRQRFRALVAEAARAQPTPLACDLPLKPEARP